METADIKNYIKIRAFQKSLKNNNPPLGIKETDVLFELYLADGGWVPYSFLIKKTGQTNSDLSSRSLKPLETKGYAEKRINKNHSGDARITLKGKELVDKL